MGVPFTRSQIRHARIENRFRVRVVNKQLKVLLGTAGGWAGGGKEAALSYPKQVLDSIFIVSRSLCNEAILLPSEHLQRTCFC